MSRIALKWGIAAFAFATIFGSVVAKAQTLRDLTVEQTQAYHAGQAKPTSLSVVTLLDRADATYAIGETVRLAVKSTEDAYLTVFNIGASGKVTRLFPNAAQPDNRVKAGEAVEIPSAASGAQIKVSGPVGAELIKVIATSKPVTVIPDSQFQSGSGVFRNLDGGTAALNRDLEVVTSNPPPETKVAVVNQVIRTIPARVTGAPGSGVLVVPTAGAVLVGAPAQTFPLLLASDKAVYRMGERVTMAVTSLQACHLRVIGTDAAGRSRFLFPTAALPMGQIGALQTVMISGGPAPQALVAITPGQETITALCTSDPPSIPAPLKTTTDVLSADERSGFDRDLAVVPTRPTGSAGIAQISLTITP